MTIRTNNTCVFLCWFITSFSVYSQPSLQGIVQTQFVLNDIEEPSYLNGGTGIIRHDSSDSMTISQALLSISGDISTAWSYHAILNYTDSPKSHAGAVQAFLKYKPLSAKDYRWEIRAGMFYPKFGFENPDIGWISPYSYTNSAISSWIGEEVRTLGTEFQISLPGRTRRSPHSFALISSLYKGNDPTGTLLAWRGWALHDRQSLINEKVFFADYPTIGSGEILAPQSPWVEPFREVDGRFGYLMGAHWDYKQSFKSRYYYYNNNADETVLARGGQYAWHTKFHSVAWQYRANRNWRVIGHWMEGDTAMGPGAVHVDFSSWYLMANYRNQSHNASVRFDWFDTTDVDSLVPQDINDGQGNAFTYTYKYTLDDHWQIGMEYVDVESHQRSRSQWPDKDEYLDQELLMAVTQYRF